MKKYHQTKGACPLIDDHCLYIYIGAFGEGPQVESILDGKYVFPDNTNQSVKIFMRHLKRPNTVLNKEYPTLMSLADYRQSWKTVKEIRPHKDHPPECIKQRLSTPY